jgi:hypothetical protein
MKRPRRHKHDEPPFKDYVMAELRAAHIRARMLNPMTAPAICCRCCVTFAQLLSATCLEHK